MLDLSRRNACRAPAAALEACLLLGLAAGVGCSHPHETDDERIRRQAAESTRQLRQDAQTAGVEARKAVRQAGREAKDIVAGVKEGWQTGAPPATRVDLNTASAAQLSALPGVSAAIARRIIRKRPYSAAQDLVTRGVISQAQYDRLSGRLAAGGPESR